MNLQESTQYSLLRDDGVPLLDLLWKPGIGPGLRSSTSNNTLHRRDLQRAAQLDPTITIQPLERSRLLPSVSQNPTREIALCETKPINTNAHRSTEIDPWDMPVPYTTMILEWYGYRDPLNATDAARCVQKALVETTDHLMMGEDHIPLASAPYSHSHAGVRLWWRVAEGKSLSWGIWSRVVYQIPVYGQRNEWRGAQFVVFGAASGDVVNGYLLAE